MDLTSERQIRAFASYLKKMCRQGHSLEYFINNVSLVMQKMN
jgi:hypothetical protein